jgi:PRC-barrel domain protein
MIFRILALGSAAAFAVAAFAGTSVAQQSYYNTHPTPEERTQTGALNAQQAKDNGTTVDGQPGSIADAQYNAQQLQYQNQLEQYKSQKNQYQNRLERYEYDRSHPSDWWHARYDHATLDGFYAVPRQNLIGKEVDERDGLRLGHIRDVEHTPDGRVERVDVALNFNRATWIDATNLRYDASAQVMFTDVPADELYDRSRDGNFYPRP